MKTNAKQLEDIEVLGVLVPGKVRNVDAVQYAIARLVEADGRYRSPISAFCRYSYAEEVQRARSGLRAWILHALKSLES